MPLDLNAPVRVIYAASVEEDRALLPVTLGYLPPAPATIRASLSRPEGASLVEYAEDNLHVSSVLAPLVIWFLGFSLSSLCNIAYACYLLSTNGTWGRFSKITFKELLWNFVLVSEVGGAGHRGRGLTAMYLESSNYMVSREWSWSQKVLLLILLVMTRLANALWTRKSQVCSLHPCPDPILVTAPPKWYRTSGFPEGELLMSPLPQNPEDTPWTGRSTNDGRTPTLDSGEFHSISRSGGGT